MRPSAIVRLKNIAIGCKDRLVLIAGPCVIEGERSAIRHARALLKICSGLQIPLVYKSSYDKANRSSIHSFRGVGLKEGLRILKKVKSETGAAILTDIHSPFEASQAAEVADILQVPAFLCRQTDILVAAALTGKAVNVKKGQFMAPSEMKNVVDKIVSNGNRRVLLTERGTFFGYNQLVNDFRSIPLMKEFGCPVIFDATHSVQQPGGRGTVSGGERRFVPMLARAAVACGADGIFMEVHENPDKAPSDGPNMLPLKGLKEILETLIRYKNVQKK